MTACSRCHEPIASGKPRVSVGVAGSPRHAHYHGHCWAEYMGLTAAAKREAMDQEQRLAQQVERQADIWELIAQSEGKR